MAENTSQKICPSCGQSNSPNAKFCGKCGSRLDAERCTVCGAELTPDMDFCVNCGAKVERKQIKRDCPSCGKPYEEGESYCMFCGARLDGAIDKTAPTSSTASTAAAPAPAGDASPKKTPSASVGARCKAIGSAAASYEGRTHLMSNLIVLILSVVFLFVALFAPIEVAFDASALGIDEETETSADSEAEGVDQTIWQVLGAYKYIGLDINDSSDKAVIDEMKAEFSEVMQDVMIEYSVWLAVNQNKPDAEKQEKLYDCVTDALSELNMLGLLTVITTPGVYTAWELGDEAALGSALDEMYNSLVMSIIMATVTAAIQIAIAVISLVFAILCIMNIMRKRAAKPYKFMFICLLLAGLGQLFTFIAPRLVPGGACAAIILVTAIVWLSCGLVAGVAKGNAVLMIRRALVCVCAIVAFAVLSGNILSFVTSVHNGEVNSETTTYASIGIAVDGLLTIGYVDNMAGVLVAYSSLSVAKLVTTIALSLTVYAVMLVGLICCLKAISSPESRKSGAGVLLAVAVTVAALAITCAVMSGADSYPTVNNGAAVKIGAFAAAPMYVCGSFAAAAFVVDIVFGCLTKPRPAAQSNSSISAKTPDPEKTVAESAPAEETAAPEETAAAPDAER